MEEKSRRVIEDIKEVLEREDYEEKLAGTKQKVLLLPTQKVLLSPLNDSLFNKDGSPRSDSEGDLPLFS